MTRHSSVALVAANLFPLAGVLWLDWRVLDILLLYWAESVVIGGVNVMRMATCRSGGLAAAVLPGRSLADLPPDAAARLANVPELPFKLFLIPFFCVHYGMFCWGHLMAVVGFFGDSAPGTAEAGLAELWRPGLWVAVAAIAASHLYSFATNYLGRGEYTRANLMLLMQRPYGRIVVMHVTILLGAGLLIVLGSPLPMLLVLIGGKIALDLKLHLGERRKLGAFLM